VIGGYSRCIGFVLIREIRGALFCRGLCLYPKAMTADKNGYTPMQTSRSTIGVHPQ